MKMEINNYDHVADLYDIYVPATFDIDFFVAETKKTSGEVLELMSGSGRVSISLIEAGVKLTCVDLSAGLNDILIDKLHKKGLKADIYQMDVCELELQKKFDMIIIPFSSFAHITPLPTLLRQMTSVMHLYEFANIYYLAALSFAPWGIRHYDKRLLTANCVCSENIQSLRHKVFYFSGSLKILAMMMNKL